MAEMNQPPQGWGSQPGQYGPQGQGYGAPPGYPPPKKKGMSFLMVMLIIMGGMLVLGFGSCVVCVGLAGKAATTAPVASPPSPHDEFVAAEQRALAVCQAMENAGVVASCKANDAPLRENVGWALVRFQPVGMFPDDTGEVDCYPNDTAYAKADPIDPSTATDDFPNMTAASPNSRCRVSLGTDAKMTNAKSDECIQKHMNLPVKQRLQACNKEINYEGKWAECMDKKKVVLACAKTYPSQYAKARAWYEAAKSSVETAPTSQALAAAAGQIRDQVQADDLATSKFLDDCKRGVRSKLTLPDSADFHFVGIALEVVKLGGGGRSWRSDVTSKNAFGTELKHNFKCVSDPAKGLEVTVE